MQSKTGSSRQIVGTVTRRGQVTIPAEVRRVLGANTPGKIVFEIEDGQVRLVRPSFTLETAFGSVKPLSRPEDVDRILREVKEERVEQLLEELRRE